MSNNNQSKNENKNSLEKIIYNIDNIRKQVEKNHRLANNPNQN